MYLLFFVTSGEYTYFQACLVNFPDGKSRKDRSISGQPSWLISTLGYNFMMRKLQTSSSFTMLRNICHTLTADFTAFVKKFLCMPWNCSCSTVTFKWKARDLNEFLEDKLSVFLSFNGIFFSSHPWPSVSFLLWNSLSQENIN